MYDHPYDNPQGAEYESQAEKEAGEWEEEQYTVVYEGIKPRGVGFAVNVSELVLADGVSVAHFDLSSLAAITITAKKTITERAPHSTSSSLSGFIRYYPPLPRLIGLVRGLVTEDHRSAGFIPAFYPVADVKVLEVVDCLTEVGSRPAEGAGGKESFIGWWPLQGACP